MGIIITSSTAVDDITLQVNNGGMIEIKPNELISIYTGSTATTAITSTASEIMELCSSKKAIKENQKVLVDIFLYINTNTSSGNAGEIEVFVKKEDGTDTGVYKEEFANSFGRSFKISFIEEIANIGDELKYKIWARRVGGTQNSGLAWGQIKYTLLY